MRPLTAARDEVAVDAGPLIDVHVVLGRVLWRIGPAWSVLAGALAAGAPVTTSDALLRLAAAVVLADIGWGILRKLVPSQPAGPAPHAAALPSLPYAQPAAPLTRFLHFLAAGFAESPSKFRSAWQSLLAGLGLVVALSWLLGGAALIVSALAVGVVLLASALARRGDRPALCLALLDVALPWVIGASLIGHAPRGLLASGVALALAFTLLQWGLHRARLAEAGWRGGIWLGQAAVLVVLGGLRQPWALGVTAILFAPPAWWLAKQGVSARWMTSGLPWWWAAMLIAAAAIRT